MLYARYRVCEVVAFDGHANEIYTRVVHRLDGVFTTEGSSSHLVVRIGPLDDHGFAPGDDVFVLANMGEVHGMGVSRIGRVISVHKTLQAATEAYPEWRPFRENDRVQLLHGKLDAVGLEPHRFLEEHSAHLVELQVQERQRQYWINARASERASEGSTGVR